MNRTRTGEVSLVDRATSAAIYAIALLIVLGSVGPATANAAPGDLDESFSGDGVETFPRSLDPSSMAAQPDGGLLVVITAKGTEPTASVARYLPSGALDPSFGVGGRASLVPPALGAVATRGGRVVVAPDGRILVTGAARLARGGGYSSFVSRLLPDGSIDPSFGSGGVVVVGDFVGELALDSVRRIVITTDNREITRLSRDGSTDTSFAADGSTDISPLVITAMAVAADDGIVVGAYTTEFEPGRSSHRVARLSEDGELDGGFGTAGTIDIVPPQLMYQHVASVAIDSAGRILAGAQGCTGIQLGPGGGTGSNRCEFAALRFSAQGNPDTSFAANGRLSGLTGAELLIDADQLVVAGSAPADRRIRSDYPSGFAVSLFDVNAMPIADFGIDGTAYAYSDLGGGRPQLVMRTADDETVVLGDGDDQRERILVFEAAGAPGDRDADLHPDDRDRCSLFASKSRDGCPRAERRLLVEQPPPSGISVTIDSKLVACERDQRVLLKRVSRGADDVVARARTDSAGGPRVIFRGGLGPGRYYAQIRRSFAPGFAHCKRARSVRVRIP